MLAHGALLLALNVLLRMPKPLNSFSIPNSSCRSCISSWCTAVLCGAAPVQPKWRLCCTVSSLNRERCTCASACACCSCASIALAPCHSSPDVLP